MTFKMNERIDIDVLEARMGRLEELIKLFLAEFHQLLQPEMADFPAICHLGGRKISAQVLGEKKARDCEFEVLL